MLYHSAGKFYKMRNSKLLAILLTGVLFFMLICPLVDAATSQKATASQPKHHCTGEQQQDNNKENDKDQRFEDCCSQNVIPVQQFHPGFAGSTLFLLQSDTTIEDFFPHQTVLSSTSLVLPTDKPLAKLSILRI